MPEFFVQESAVRTKEPLRPESAEEALEMSIVKWQTIVEYMKKHNSIPLCGKGETCSLCQTAVSCRGCPVYEKTEVKQCLGTPYDDWTGASDFEAALAAAEAELEFLKGILSDSRTERKAIAIKEVKP